MTDHEPWATLVQSKLRNAHVPTRDGSNFRLWLASEVSLIESIFVWRHVIQECPQTQQTTAFFRFEFLATHYGLRRTGLGARAYAEFIENTYDILDANPNVTRAAYEADVHKGNLPMRTFMRLSGWDATNESIDNDYMVFVMNIEVESLEEYEAPNLESSEQEKVPSMRFEFKIQVFPEDVDQAATFAIVLGEDEYGDPVAMLPADPSEKVQAAVSKIILDALRDKGPGAGLGSSYGMQSRVLPNLLESE